MAGTNVNFAMGLQPQFAANGQSPPTIRLPLKQSVSSVKQATAIYRGQMVQFAGTGWVKGCASAADFTNAVFGVAAEYYAGSAASTQTDLAVWKFQRGQHWLIQLNNTTALGNLWTVMDKGVNVTAIDDGNTNSGISTMVANAASIQADTARQFDIKGVNKLSGGRKVGPYAQLIVEPNEAGADIEVWDELGT